MKEYKCPLCKETITYLRLFEKAEVSYDCQLDERGYFQADHRDTYALDDEPQCYECPACGEELFDTEEAACEFLGVRNLRI